MSDSTCCVCMETLPSGGGGIGAVVPCGHCLHIDCFRGWEASAINSVCYSGRKTNAKCPMCNVPSTNFLKLFLDIPQGEEEESDSDDSSDEESVSCRQEEEDNKQSDAVVLDENDNPGQVHNGSSSQQVIEILDVDEPCPPPRRDEQCSTSQDELDRKKAKRYKKRFKQLQSQNRELIAKHRQLLAKHSSLNDDLDEQIELVEKLESDSGRWSLERVDMKIELETAKREFSLARESLDTVTIELNQAHTELGEMRRTHRLEMERSNARNMAEVKNLLEEHPKLVHQVQKLKEGILQKQNVIDGLKKRNAYLLNLVNEKVDQEVFSSKPPPSKKKMATTLRQVSDAQEAAAVSYNNKKQATSSQKRNNNSATLSYSGKMSQQSARMSKAVAKKSRKAADALDMASHKPTAKTSLVISSKKVRTNNNISRAPTPDDKENNHMRSQLQPLQRKHSFEKRKSDLRDHFSLRH